MIERLSLSSQMRYTNRTVLGLVMLVGVCITLPADADQHLQHTGKASENILATLRLPDGSIVQFHEPVPGEVVILAQTPTGRSDMVNGADPKSLENLDPQEIYSTLSGGLQVPSALIEAQQRVEQARREQADALPEMSLEEAQPDIVPASDRSTRKTSRSGDGLPAPSLTPEAQSLSDYPVGSGLWFRENYCIWSEQCYCYTYRTGDGTVTLQSTNMNSRAYAYRGNVTQKLEYHDCFLGIFCSWNTNITQTVYQGYVGYIWARGSDRTRRASLRDAAGDGFHWAVYGGELERICHHAPPITCACQNT